MARRVTPDLHEQDPFLALLRRTSAEAVFTPALARHVFLRRYRRDGCGASDHRVWSDTFTGLYHVPPASMPTPRTVLDLGANIGLTAAHYLALWPAADVLAVEMDDENAALLDRNAPAARHVVAAVVGYRPGLALYDEAAGSDAYAVGADLSSPTGRVTRARTLRQLILRGFGEVGVDFVKMDVEGMEWRLFERGAEWAPLVRHLLIELHPRGSWGGGDKHGTSGLVEMALGALEELGFDAAPHPPHPQAVFAARR